MDIGAGVAGLIALADLIIGKTIRYSLEVKHAESTIVSFLDETKSLLGILKQIEHTSKQYLEQHELAIDNSVKEHVDVCSQLLSEIRDQLQEGELRKSTLSKIKREILWPFSSSKTKDIVQRLERSKSNLALAFSTKNWLITHEQNTKRESELKTLQEKVASRHISQDLQRIFKWLGDVNHAKLQNNGIALRSHLGSPTGQWFFRGEEFKKWMQAAGSKLWVHGIPGAGKTVLTYVSYAARILYLWDASKSFLTYYRSTIIQHIQELLEAPSGNGDVLAYFYCDFRDKATTQTWNILGSLIKQLAEQNRECLHQLEVFYKTYNPLGSTPKNCGEEDLCQLLVQMAQQFDNNVIIIVDGLDEIENNRADTIELLRSLDEVQQPEMDSSGALTPGGLPVTPTATPRRPAHTSFHIVEDATCTADMRIDAEDLTANDQPNGSSGIGSTGSTIRTSMPRIKLLFVSRSQRDIESRLEDFQQQVIQARPDDLLLYVASEIEHRIFKRQMRFSDEALKEEIIDGLVKNAQGMFRWVACQIDYLGKLHNSNEKRKALAQLPRDLPQTYDRILREIDESHVELVHKTLQWVISAAKPLPIKALLEALAISEGDSDLDSQSMTDEETLLECCSSLLKKSQTVQGALELAHFSVKQYLLSINSHSAPEIAKYQISEGQSSLLLAKSCLTYLNFRCFSHGPEQSSEDYRDVLLQRPFLQHASKYWDTYSQNHFSHPLIVSLSTALFSPPNIGNFRHWNQVMFFSINKDINMTSSVYQACMAATPMHWAALLALPEIVVHLLKDFSPNCASGIGEPLYCALFGPGLIRNDLSVLTIAEAIKQKSWRAPSRILTVQKLLEAGADANNESAILANHDALHIAFHGTDNQTDFVTPLLKAGAKITPATLACAVQFKDDIEVTPGIIALIQGGDNSLQNESSRETFLEIKAHLPSFRASFNGKNERSQQMMMATTNRKEVYRALRTDVRLGLAWRVDKRLEAIKNSPQLEMFSAHIQDNFHYCIRHDWREIVEVFLRHGAKVDRETFSLAVGCRASKIVARLLELNNTIATSADFFTAIKNGDFATFSTLKLAGVDLTSVDDHGCLPIHEALANHSQGGESDRELIIKALVELEPPLDVPNFTGDLPIHYAALLGMSEVVRGFIARSSPVDVENHRGCRPSHNASNKDSAETLQLLLDAGADVHAKRAGIGGTPLHYAVTSHATRCTRLLIDAGADMEQKSASQYTPLVLACLNIRWNTARILLDSGADSNAIDPETHNTPLMMASQHGAIDIVEMIVKQKPDLDKQNLRGENALFLAAVCGHIQIVDILLKSNAAVDANRRSLDGTPLQWAILHGFSDSWELVKYIALKGADVTVADISGRTVLHNAAAYSQLDLVVILFSKGATVLSRCAKGRTPLMDAARSGDLSVIKFLIEKGADVSARDSTAEGSTALLAALKYNSTHEVVEYLLDHGANASDHFLESKETALMLAVKGEDIATVQALLSYGAEVNVQRTSDLRTAILVAVNHEKPEMCKLLLEHGIDISLTDGIGRTIAHHIASSGNLQILKHFLASDMDWNQSQGAHFVDFETELTGYGISPLHLAAKYNFAEFLNLLHEQNSINDVNVKCGGNLMPLHFAARSGHLAIVEALLVRGACVDAVTTIKGQTALHMAASGNNLKCVSALLKRGARPDRLDKHGRAAAELSSDALVTHVIKKALDEQHNDPSSLLVTRDSLDSGGGELTALSTAADPRSIKFSKACEDGDLSSCRQLLSLGVNCNAKPSAEASPPLLVAMSSQSSYNKQLIHFLIDNGADINSQAGPKVARAGYQAIHYAVWAGSEDILRKLLYMKANVSDFGLEPIHIAAYQGKVNMVSILRDYECLSAGGSAMRMLDAQVRDQAQFPKKCLAAGPVYATGNRSTGTPLHLAACAGKNDVISMLLERGAKVDAIDGRGRTPLHQAVYTGHLGAVKLLLDSGANIEARDRCGCTPFLLSAKERTEIMDELIKRSSDVNAIDGYGRNAVFLAIDPADSEKSPIPMLQKLLGLKLSFDTRDFTGRTVLASCLHSNEYYDDEVLEFLIDHTDSFGNSDPIYGNFLNLACEYLLSPGIVLPRLLKRLLEVFDSATFLAYINNQCSLYGTPTYWASYRGDVEMLDLLLKSGADLSVDGGPLGSGLNAACAMGRIDTIRWLLERDVRPVEVKAFELASKHDHVTLLLTRYKEMGPAGLVEESRMSPAPKLPEQNGAESSERSSGPSVGNGTSSSPNLSPLDTRADPTRLEIQTSSCPATPEPPSVVISAETEIRARLNGSRPTTPEIAQVLDALEISSINSSAKRQDGDEICGEVKQIQYSPDRRIESSSQ
ncbi:hypothetical protein VTL71DRAFT_2592 [Oculimacula yallundae]|uniref:Nephrocystin 3-like N-terminal domain-containing protein n=1 Tax=Oculimacula yallundae TaxID=86028 RepID=A0ABR4C9C3_9HELO